MTGDRPLTKEEKLWFTTKAQTDMHRLKGLGIITDSGGEPTLYDVAFIEVAGRLDALKAVIIAQSQRIEKLEKSKGGIDR